MKRMTKKKPRQAQHPKVRTISQEFNPDSYLSLHLSWKFSFMDKEKWSIFGSAQYQKFCSVVLPHLIGYEKRRRNGIKASKKQNCSIIIQNLNKCSQARLEELQIEAESLFSLRINDSTRVYGLIESDGSFEIVWIDFDHGGSADCVCRSRKKHT